MVFAGKLARLDATRSVERAFSVFLVCVSTKRVSTIKFRNSRFPQALSRESRIETSLIPIFCAPLLRFIPTKSSQFD